MADGLDQIYYFDPASHLLLANDRTVPMHAPPQRQRTAFSDWRPVAGVLYPFHLETRRLRDDGTTGDVIEDGGWSRIEANTARDQGLLVAPSVHPAPPTQLILDMYAQASSLDAVRKLQRYNTFVAEHAGDVFDTESDLTWLGYELLKDETTSKALALFDQLVREHPHSSSAWDRSLSPRCVTAPLGIARGGRPTWRCAKYGGSCMQGTSGSSMPIYGNTWIVHLDASFKYSRHARGGLTRGPLMGSAHAEQLMV